MAIIDDKREIGSKVIKFRVTPSQYERIKEYADKHGGNLAKVLRNIVIEVVDKTAVDEQEFAPEGKTPERSQKKKPTPKAPKPTKKKPPATKPKEQEEEQAPEIPEDPRDKTKPRPKGIYSYFTFLPPKKQQEVITRIRKEAETMHLSLELELEHAERRMLKEMEEKKK